MSMPELAELQAVNKVYPLKQPSERGATVTFLGTFLGADLYVLEQYFTYRPEDDRKVYHVAAVLGNEEECVVQAKVTFDEWERPSVTSEEMHRADVAMFGHAASLALYEAMRRAHKYYCFRL